MQVVLGTLLAALVPVVGFNAVMTSEHFASFLVSLCLFFSVLLDMFINLASLESLKFHFASVMCLKQRVFQLVYCI